MYNVNILTSTLPFALVHDNQPENTTMLAHSLRRTFATVAEGPKRSFGGLKDCDRIFTNLYEQYGADLKSAQKSVY